MIFFFIVNLFCYLLLCSMVFFPFRDKWYLDDSTAMDEEEKNSGYGDNSGEEAELDRDSEGSESEVNSARTSNKVKRDPSKSGETVNARDTGVRMFKKCFDLISAVDYLNLDGDSVEGPVENYVLKPPEKKFGGSMFEDLLKCLEGKTRTDFYTWEDVLSGRKDSIKILLNRGFSINGTDREGDSLLHYACRTNDQTTVKDLLEKGAQIFSNKKLESPLHICVSNSDMELTQILLENGAVVNTADTHGYTALHLAAKASHHELVKIVLKYGADLRARTNGNLLPVHFAVKSTDVLKLLIKQNVDLNCWSKDGCTPLHLAARGSYYESMELLLKNNALVNVRDVNGSTPLLVQCKNFSFFSEDNVKCFDCVKLLLDRGACVNLPDYCGSTPLHFASENELVDVMELLLEFGADPNVVSTIGDSPLHIAVRNQSLEVVYTLLEWGADVTVAGALGETPLDISAQSLLMFNVWNYSSEVLVKHIGKLSSAGSSLTPSESLSILTKKMSSEFLRRCSEEITKLSAKTFSNPVSYLEILTASQGNLTKFTRNAQVEVSYLTGDYLNDYPLYSGLLTLRFRQGFERNYLLNKCFNFFKNAAPHLPRLHFDCFEYLSKYLSLADLRNLAHACQRDRTKASCSICKGTVNLPKQKVAQPPGTKRFHLIKILNY